VKWDKSEKWEIIRNMRDRVRIENREGEFGYLPNLPRSLQQFPSLSLAVNTKPRFVSRIRATLTIPSFNLEYFAALSRDDDSPNKGKYIRACTLKPIVYKLYCKTLRHKKILLIRDRNDVTTHACTCIRWVQSHPVCTYMRDHHTSLPV